MYQEMKPLVTGCAGFIGSHLTDRLLADGYEVTGIDLIREMEHHCRKSAKIVPASKQKGDTRETLADNRKAHVSLGWMPKVTVHEGIERYVTWVNGVKG